MSFDTLSDTELETIARGLRSAVELRTTRRLDYFQPYRKQLEFFALGKEKRERLYMAGNQFFGKTTSGAVEAAYHLTGLYPDWWPGRKWDRPVKGWAVGESTAWVRDHAQARLCGEPLRAGSPDAPEWGTGWIPKEHLLSRTLIHGTQHAFDAISVRHVPTGGTSVLSFKSYEQGREKVQGGSVDFVWPDEEPPADVYTELQARITMTKGMIMVTFTPLSGFTDVIKLFLHDDSPASLAIRGTVKAGIRDIEGQTPEYIEQIIATYPEHERAARLNGEPLMGEGAVWDGITRDMIECPPMPLKEIPLEWRKLWGIDFGIGHPFAAVLVCHDPDTDICYLVHEVRMKDALPPSHIAAMRSVGADVPVAWPHDGGSREKSSGVELFRYYKPDPAHNAPGLIMRPTWATLSTGGFSTEAGITECLTRMRSGRFFVCSTLRRWWEEFSAYYRKNGLIVKKDDDLMSATRIATMDIRFAKSVPLGGRSSAPGVVLSRQAPKCDPFTGLPL